jgi:histone deacetylase 1/2
MGLALLANASMPLKYWDQAFLAAAYLINRTPSKVIDFDTPVHKLFAKQPDYSSMRVFGCACWPHLRLYNAHKLQYRSKSCVFLGYSNMHKGFKCLDVSEDRIYIYRDLLFDENLFPFSELHSNVGTHFRSEVLLLPTSGGMSSETNEFEAPSSSPNPACVDAEENSVLQHEIPPQEAFAPTDPTGANSEEDTSLSSLQTAPASPPGSFLDSPAAAA